jgi:carbonic anhydrase
MKNIQNSNIGISRRKLMKFGAGFLGSATLATAIGLNLKDPAPAVSQNTPTALGNDITPDRALAELMAGNQRFLKQQTTNNNQSLDYLKSIAEDQKPFAAIIGCADSRSSLEVVFDRGFGELFVVRDAGNVATQEETGSLEFGTLVLGAKVIMVLGHYSCGAVKAALKGDPVPGSIGSILAQIEPAVESYKGQQDDKEALRKATEANVVYQVDKLKKSPVLSELIASDQLKIVGGYFNFTTGEVTLVG